MSRPLASLGAFLAQARRALDDAVRQRSPITFVLGNESADLDSLCSAVILAYLRSHTSTSSDSSGATLYVPLANLPRTDVDLRPELVPVLSCANVAPGDLITLSDLPSLTSITNQVPPENTRWLLVDHNIMTGGLGKIYGQRLVGCIDHHVEENKVPRGRDDDPRIVTKCGSCTTLVAEYCRDTWDQLAKQTSDGKQTNETQSHEDGVAYMKGLAQMALGPILIDTSSLDNKAETTSRDIELVDFLESFITSHGGRGSYDRASYYRTISDAKQDLSKLSLCDILRKDYKQYDEGSIKLGIASAVRGMQFLIDDKAGGSREELNATVAEFARERGLHLFALMTKLTKPAGDVKEGAGFARELLLYATDQRAAAVGRRFEADYTSALGLRKWEDGSLDFGADESGKGREEIDDEDRQEQKHQGEWQRCWWQDRVENSRKQVAPLLRGAIGKASHL